MKAPTFTSLVVSYSQLQKDVWYGDLGTIHKIEVLFLIQNQKNVNQKSLYSIPYCCLSDFWFAKTVIELIA